jgi:hypothetical protein
VAESGEFGAGSKELEDRRRKSEVGGQGAGKPTVWSPAQQCLPEFSGLGLS